MRIDYKSIEPYLNSLNHEVIVTFEVKGIEPQLGLSNTYGELYTEDGKKIDNLILTSESNNMYTHLHAKGTNANVRRTSDFGIM